MIYLDYAANYPTKKEVLDELIAVEEEYYGNCNSLHVLGERSREKLTSITTHISSLLGLKDDQEIVYTSSATEANNLAIKGYVESYQAFGKRILTSEFEHNSVNAPLSYLKEKGFEIEFVRTNKNGQIDLQDLESKLNDQTLLVCLSLVDSELGTLQPYKEVLNLVHQRKNAKLLLDATQGIGKLAFSFEDCDFVSFTPHKFGGLIGTGLLVKKKNLILSPLLHGGKSDSIYRSSTTPLSLIASSEKAIELAIGNQETNFKYVNELASYLRRELLQIKGVVLNSFESNPYIINFSYPPLRSSKMIEAFSKRDICLSQKSACSLTNTPSKIVMAVYKDRSRALSSLRISLSDKTTKEELEAFLTALKEIIHESK